MHLDKWDKEGILLLHQMLSLSPSPHRSPTRLFFSHGVLCVVLSIRDRELAGLHPWRGARTVEVRHAAGRVEARRHRHVQLLVREHQRARLVLRMGRRGGAA